MSGITAGVGIIATTPKTNIWVVAYHSDVKCITTARSNHFFK